MQPDKSTIQGRNQDVTFFKISEADALNLCESADLKVLTPSENFCNNCGTVLAESLMTENAKIVDVSFVRTGNLAV